MTAQRRSAPDPMLREHEAAARLGIAERTLRERRFLQVDHPPYVQLGRLVRYRTSAVESYIDSHTVDARS